MKDSQNTKCEFHSVSTYFGEYGGFFFKKEKSSSVCHVCLYALRMSEVILGPRASLSTLLETESQQDCSILHTPGFRGPSCPSHRRAGIARVRVTRLFMVLRIRTLSTSRVCGWCFTAGVVSPPQNLFFEWLFTNERNLSRRQ